MARPDGRSWDQARNTVIIPGYQKFAEGSALIEGIRKSPATSSATLLLVVLLSGCSGGAEPEPSGAGSQTDAPFDATGALGEVLTFHASFDDGIDADWALGDPQIYASPDIKVGRS